MKIVFLLLLTFLLLQFILIVPETLRPWVRNTKCYPIVVLLPKEGEARRGKPTIVLSASPMLYAPETQRHNILASKVYFNQVEGNDGRMTGQTYMQIPPAPTSGAVTASREERTSLWNDRRHSSHQFFSLTYMPFLWLETIDAGLLLNQSKTKQNSISWWTKRQTHVSILRCRYYFSASGFWAFGTMGFSWGHLDLLNKNQPSDLSFQ